MKNILLAITLTVAFLVTGTATFADTPTFGGGPCFEPGYTDGDGVTTDRNTDDPCRPRCEISYLNVITGVVGSFVGDEDAIVCHNPIRECDSTDVCFN